MPQSGTPAWKPEKHSRKPERRSFAGSSRSRGSIHSLRCSTHGRALFQSARAPPLPPPGSNDTRLPQAERAKQRPETKQSFSWHIPDQTVALQCPEVNRVKPVHNRTLRSLRAFRITDTELKAMAAPAIT